MATRRHKWEGDYYYYYYYHVQDMINVRAACLAECRAILEALLAGNGEAATEAIRRSITRIMVMASAL